MKIIVNYEQQSDVYTFELLFEDQTFQQFKREVCRYLQIDEFDIVFYYIDNQNEPNLLLNQFDFSRTIDTQQNKNTEYFELYITQKAQIFFIQNSFDQRAFYRIFIEDFKELEILQDSQDEIKLTILVNKIKKYLQLYDVADDVIDILMENLKQVYQEWLLNGTDPSEYCSKYLNDHTLDFTLTVTEKSSKNSYIIEEKPQDFTIQNNSMFQHKKDAQQNILNYTQYSIYKSQMNQSDKETNTNDVHSQIDISNIDSVLVEGLFKDQKILEQSQLNENCGFDDFENDSLLKYISNIDLNEKDQQDSSKNEQKSLKKNPQKNFKKKKPKGMPNPALTMINLAKNKIKRPKKKDKDSSKKNNTKKKQKEQNKQQSIQKLIVSMQNTQKNQNLFVKQKSSQEQTNEKKTYIKSTSDSSKKQQTENKTEKKIQNNKAVKNFLPLKTKLNSKQQTTQAPFKFNYDKEKQKFNKNFTPNYNMFQQLIIPFNKFFLNYQKNKYFSLVQSFEFQDCFNFKLVKKFMKKEFYLQFQCKTKK